MGKIKTAKKELKDLYINCHAMSLENIESKLKEIIGILEAQKVFRLTGQRKDLFLKIRNAYRDQQFMVKDFQNGANFIGYEAGARMAELCHMGLVECVGKERGTKRQIFNIYQLTGKGKEYQV